ncbi:MULTISPECIES: ArsR/SmtB family transcription factor [Actinoallomurus]|uniref:ArsR/SmtB family transcription factor n=1 Tax=Actinoallomurus TaxID=667113 RepID=UPI0020914824|nr:MULTISPECIES: metalloregulator ArsR/SmtB family transcription factor [Actinoallomurus]MCO5972989.1 ArsR family transcriptional regulator [Actinoallomurus soli]MCO5992960.1 ArsR family transcriptional regulator [Actinoallomurus rhizosphaericola]
MSSSRRPKPTPPAPELHLATVMRTLGDPVRLEIVRLLADGKLRSTGQVAEHVGLPPSTCSYHLKQLLGAGVNECRAEGTSRYPVLRREALDQRFPGLIDAILADGPAQASEV